MSPALKYLKEIALSLPDDDRYELIDALVNDSRSSAPMTAIDEAWLEETIKRRDSYDSGKLTSRDAFEALEDVYKKIVPQK